MNFNLSQNINSLSNSRNNNNGKLDYQKILDKPDFDKIALHKIQKQLIEKRQYSEQQMEQFNNYRKEQDICQVIEGQYCFDNQLEVFDSFEEIRKIDQHIYKEMKRKFEKPMCIQAQCWPVLFQGNDLIGIGQTGSGKTLGYLVPMVAHIKRQAMYKQQVMGLVIGPTRELVKQIYEKCEEMVGDDEVKVDIVYGGTNKEQQISQLRKNQSDIIIGTPGRIIDLLQEKVIDINHVSYLVMDEADRMLEMGFKNQIKAIFSQIRSDRQVCMWSATWPQEIRKIADEFLVDPIHIQIGVKDEQSNNHDIQQFFIITDQHRKLEWFNQILYQVDIRNLKSIIFTQTINQCNQLSHLLRQWGFQNQCIHRKKQQSDREQIMKQFRRNNHFLLVATDVVGRGLDIYDIDLVINYELPTNIYDYLHRIGRTGRAGKKGVSLSFLVQSNIGLVDKVIANLTDQQQPINVNLIILQEFQQNLKNIKSEIQQLQSQLKQIKIEIQNKSDNYNQLNQEVVQFYQLGQVNKCQKSIQQPQTIQNNDQISNSSCQKIQIQFQLCQKQCQQLLQQLQSFQQMSNQIEQKIQNHSIMSHSYSKQIDQFISNLELRMQINFESINQLIKQNYQDRSNYYKGDYIYRLNDSTKTQDRIERYVKYNIN